jgi:hypothetical protein
MNIAQQSGRAVPTQRSSRRFYSIFDGAPMADPEEPAG